MYVKAEQGKLDRRSYRLVLCHGSDPAKTQETVENVSIAEAADHMVHAARMPSNPSVEEYRKAVKDLRQTGEKYEKERAGKTRHTGSISGGKGRGAAFTGNLELALKAGVAVGFLPKAP